MMSVILLSILYYLCKLLVLPLAIVFHLIDAFAWLLSFHNNTENKFSSTFTRKEIKSYEIDFECENINGCFIVPLGESLNNVFETYEKIKKDNPKAKNFKIKIIRNKEN